MSRSDTPDPPPRRRACCVCARRKIKCDRTDPCLHCRQTGDECTYTSSLVRRPRAKATDKDLAARLAQYEGLMRSNGIDFTQHSNIWMPPEGTPNTEIKHGSPDTVSTGPKPAPLPVSEEPSNPRRPVWLDLRHELQFPPTQFIRQKDDPVFQPAASLHDILTTTTPVIHELHPEPRHIYQLWTMFVERVDPLIKFVHVPSLHKHILQAAWDPRALSRAHQALVFSIYVLATTSVPPSECATTFGEPRSSMLQRHRAAALRALVAADVFSTRDFDVLQALVLYLFSDPESALSSTLMAVAVKVAQILGLPAAGLAGVPGGEGEQGQLSVFESEVRLRLLWQLRGLDVRTAAIALLPARPLTAPADVTFGAPPLNVNDADLHPAMTEPPIPHRGPTEMLLPLVKYEFAMWFKSAPTGRLIIQSFHSSSTGPAAAPRPSVRELDAAIDDLERHGVVRDRPLDDRVPLQALVRYMVAHHVSSVRFKVHHPRRLLGARGRGVATTDADTSQTMDQRELDCLFDWGLDMLESRVAVARSNFATHLYIHMTSRLDMDALIYVVAELRHREATPKVNRAWELVHGLFSDCETVLLEAEGPFYTALGDLVLDSWDSRMQGMLPDQTPSYIQTLRAARAERDGGAEQSEFARQDMYDWDGTYWSSFFNFQ